MINYTLAAEYVADTVSLVLYLENRKTGAIAEQIYDSVENGTSIVHIPAMVFAEILYLSEKKRITATLTDALNLTKKSVGFKILAINGEIIENAAQITDIPELHDRIIAASAKYLNLELITNDSKIQKSAFVQTIW